MHSYISRPKYLERIKPFIGKQIIKVLVGQRRVGKSFLMYEIMDYLKQEDPSINIIYIDKEQNEFRDIVNYQDLLDYLKGILSKGNNAIFIDEIQDVEEFERALRSLYSKPNIDLYVTGSNAKMLSGELATFLSGRYIQIPVFSLTYTEFLSFHKLIDISESFQKYLKFGGLPFLINLKLDEAIVFDYLKNINQSILYRDVVMRYNVRNTEFLQNLVLYVADNIGSLVSAKKISDFLKSQNVKISVNVVIEYLTHLTSAYLIHNVKRTDIKGKKVFEIGEKYYFQDLGLRNSLLDFNLTADYGKLLENVVYAHLVATGYDVRIGKLNKLEIDFVATKGNKRTYIQVCYLLAEQSTIDREFGNLLKIKDQYPKVVLSMDEFFGESSYQGIKHKSIRSFLIEE